MNSRMYCLNCKKIFNSLYDLDNLENILTYGQFLINQHSILFNKKIKYYGNKRIKIFQCPHCLSIRTIDINKMLDKTNIYRRLIAKNYDKNILLKIARKLKKDGLILAYKIVDTPKGFYLYEQIKIKKEKNKNL